MEIPLVKLISALILPPGNSIVLMVVGTFIISRYYRLGRITILTGFGLLLLSAIPVVPMQMAKIIETIPPLSASELANPSAEAIVILSGGHHSNNQEYGGGNVNSTTLERVRYGAQLFHATRLPILVSGGMVYENEKLSEAELMRRSLHGSFRIPVKWVEDQSRNTWENALNSASMLHKAGIQRVLLVTHASHMKRAVHAFESNGLIAIPAPTMFTSADADRPFYLQLIPNAHSILLSRQLSLELIGLIWYQLRY